MKATRLRTDDLLKPIGLGNVIPRFSWNCQGGTRQTAYRLVCLRGKTVIWDTGKVASPQMTYIPYAGQPLKSRDQIVWQVQLWDEKEIPGECVQGNFEMGLLKESDWIARWITGNYSPGKSRRYSVDCFQKRFPANKRLCFARLYISACGLYEVMLNEKRVGDAQLMPGTTDYRKRIHYQTYDVTAMLKQSNTIAVQLADGWYRGSVGAFGLTNVYGKQTKLLCQLEMTYTDGTKEVIRSNSSWKWSNDGPLRFADLQDGEIFDARMQPTYAGVAREIRETVQPTAADCPPMRIHERFTPRLLITPSGKRVLDFGQNLAGFVRFHCQGTAGQTVHLLLGEALDESGEFTQRNFQLQKPVKAPGQLGTVLLITGNEKCLPGPKQPTPKQEILFTCSGGMDVYQTRFAVFGFRYALVETAVPIDPGYFEALAVYSDLEQTGFFSCSSEKVNRLFANTLWSMKSNFLDVPTDCPTRERLAWTGDGQIFFETAAFLMDAAPFYRKWLRDLSDGQLKSGQLPAVAPYSGASMLYDNTGTSAGWNDCGILLPVRFWKRYSDLQTLRESYPMLRKTALFLIRNAGSGKDYLPKDDPLNAYLYEKGVQLGEWLEPEAFREEIRPGQKQNHGEEATAYFYYALTLAAEAAQTLGEYADTERFAAFAKGAKQAYQKAFLPHGAPDTDRQAKLVRPLALGLADDRNPLEERLAYAVEKGRYRVGTGFLSTPFLLKTLTEAGRVDLAYRVLENEECPGWLYEVNQGATTLWETWEGRLTDGNSGSRNHYSPGAVCSWLMDTVSGIRPAGERHFEIIPTPGGSLTRAEGEYRSIYGTVESSWSREPEGLRFACTIPVNCTARICLPDGTCSNVSAGSYVYTIKE